MEQTNLRLSPHFTKREFTYSITALRNGIDNTRMTETQEVYAEKVCFDILEPTRVAFPTKNGFSPLSAFRCEALEKILCWKSFERFMDSTSHISMFEAWAEYFKRKQHPKGQAVDFEIPGVDNLLVAEWIRDNLYFDQLILEYYTPGDINSGWIHVSVAAEPRGQVMHTNGGGYIAELPERVCHGS